MKHLFSKFMLIAALFAFVACDEESDEPTLVDPPTEADAAFTYAATAESDNIIEFTASVDGFNRYVWDLGNGQNADEAQTVTGSFANAGTYEVTLTVFNDGGSASSSQEIEIAETDPSLLDIELYNLLTGGPDGSGSKTWAVDSASDAHFGLGPDPVGDAGYFPEYYAAPANDKTGAGMYDDRYTFSLEGFGFEMETNGDVYIRANQGENFPGSFDSGVGDLTAPFEPSGDLTWNLSFPAEGEEGDTILTTSGDSFLGFYTGTNTYRVITLEENELFVSYQDTNEDFLWYIRLVPEGYNSNPDGEPETTPATLPIGFETQTPTFDSFEGNTAAIIDNPDASGINTSGKVLELFKGFQGFSGSLFSVETPIAVQEGTTASLKVWAPETGVFRFKLENADGEFVEVDADVTVAEEWTELTFDLSAGAGFELGTVVLFPSWDVPDAGTFYVDDIDVQ